MYTVTCITIAFWNWLLLTWNWTSTFCSHVPRTQPLWGGVTGHNTSAQHAAHTQQLQLSMHAVAQQSCGQQCLQSLNYQHRTKLRNAMKISDDIILRLWVMWVRRRFSYSVVIIPVVNVHVRLNLGAVTRYQLEFLQPKQSYSPSSFLVDSSSRLSAKLLMSSSATFTKRDGNLPLLPVAPFTNMV